MSNRFKSYGFWVSLSGAIIILMQSVGSIFGFKFQAEIVENIVMAICGLLVVLGIVKKSPEKVDNKTKDENKVSDNTDNSNLKESLPVVEENTIVQSIQEESISQLEEVAREQTNFISNIEEPVNTTEVAVNFMENIELETEDNEITTKQEDVMQCNVAPVLESESIVNEIPQPVIEAKEVMIECQNLVTEVPTPVVEVEVIDLGTAALENYTCYDRNENLPQY